MGYLRPGIALKNMFVITFDDALLDFYTQALPILAEFNYPATMFIPTGMVGQKATWDSYDQNKSLMTWEQLKACQKFNISFGSHTVNHIRLTECDDAMMMHELRDSLGMLRELLENVIPALAYPGGYQDERVRKAVELAGYTCGLGASSRWGNRPETNRYQLRQQRIV